MDKEFKENPVIAYEELKKQNTLFRRELKTYHCREKFGERCTCAFKCLENEFCNRAEERIAKFKAENAKQKEMIEKQWKLLEQCGVSAGGELKRVSYLLEKLRETNKELTEDNLNLSKENKVNLSRSLDLNRELQNLSDENAELKDENDRLKEEIKTIKASRKIWEAEALKQCCIKVVDVDKYRQALREIKGIASKIISGYIRPYGDYNQLKQILDLITKAEEE